MSYFFSPVCEYRAKRITQMLAQVGQHAVSAQRDGRVMVNWDGHMHLFDLTSDRKLELIDSADLLRTKQEVTLV